MAPRKDSDPGSSGGFAHLSLKRHSPGNSVCAADAPGSQAVCVPGTRGTMGRGTARALSQGHTPDILEPTILGHAGPALPRPWCSGLGLPLSHWFQRISGFFGLPFLFIFLKKLKEMPHGWVDRPLPPQQPSEFPPVGSTAGLRPGYTV